MSKELFLGLAVGILAVPILAGLFKVLKGWPKAIGGFLKAVANYIRL